MDGGIENTSCRPGKEFDYELTRRGDPREGYNQFVRNAILLLFPMLLGAAQLTIDHVTVAGANLRTMQAALAAVGIRVEYGGLHQNHATEMALTSFVDGSYLELIAIQGDAETAAVKAHAWGGRMERNAGPCAWAVREADFDGEVKRLRAAGISVNDPVRSGRDRPDGLRLDWETAQVGTEPNGTFFPFLIRDFNPRTLRAFPSGKPTSRDFGGVSRVVIAVRNLDAAVKRYRQAYDLPEPLKQVDKGFGAQLALMGGTPVVLAAPLTGESWLAGRLAEFGEGPCAFVLSARRTGPYKAAQKSRWFGVDISWFDATRLGWHLGYE